MLMIGSKEIGGGFCRRSFTVNGERLKVGAKLSAELINSWPNKRTLIDAGFVAVYPPSGEQRPIYSERHVVSRGGGRYDVIEGIKVNDGLISKEEAEELAAH